MAFRSGRRNLITDVAGLRVGNSGDERLKSGVSVVLCDRPAVASCQVLGGAPGTRETDLLSPENTVEAVHALVLSGGSAFGLAAADGVQAALRRQGVGFEVGGHKVPIVPAAILFDLANGGDKGWGDFPPYRELGLEAVQAAREDFAIGSHGAGIGALTANLKGGLGSASTVLADGITIGALVAVNAVGAATVAETAHFWAAPFEIGGEFGGLGMPSPFPPDAAEVRTKFGAPPPAIANTTIAVIATDARLTKAECRRLAVSAHDGFARGLWPAHTPYDGDLVFALSTGARESTVDPALLMEFHAAAASTMARAIARGVYAATRAAGDLMPVWSDIAGQA